MVKYRGCGSVGAKLLLAFLLLPWAGVLADCRDNEAVTLDRVPPYFKRAIVASEDKRFYEHGGSDFRAILHAIVQNLFARRLVRGASTITEQVVRLENRIPRTLSGRIYSAKLARDLEREKSKDQILTRYLNIVSYPGDACGVVEGAKVLFGRSLSNLTERELLSLAILVRAPGALDPLKNLPALQRRMRWFEEKNPDLKPTGTLSLISREDGIRLLRSPAQKSSNGSFRRLLEARIARLRSRNVRDGAVIVLDNHSGEIVAEERVSSDSPFIDSVRTPRQPGSTLKPFLYAMAFEDGLSPDTIARDAPLLLAVGSGVHPVRNYSGQFFGEVTLREALGSSLNTPAVRLLLEVGEDRFLAKLRELGFSTFNRQVDHYGEGLILGSGEVTLEELVRGYRTLALGGLIPQTKTGPARRVFHQHAADTVTEILLDPDARRYEFGVGGLLQFPVQTAVKTGTSNDHHDAWAIGYSKRFTAGVWMGNLDRTPMREVSGSRGPAWVLREIFHQLEGDGNSKELKVANRVTEKSVRELDKGRPRIAYPADGILLRRDPRIPDTLERVKFQLTSESASARWILNGEFLGEGSSRAWTMSPGEYTLRAESLDSGEMFDSVQFQVR